MDIEQAEYTIIPYLLEEKNRKCLLEMDRIFLEWHDFEFPGGSKQLKWNKTKKELGELLTQKLIDRGVEVAQNKIGKHTSEGGRRRRLIYL